MPTVDINIDYTEFNNELLEDGIIDDEEYETQRGSLMFLLNLIYHTLNNIPEDPNEKLAINLTISNFYIDDIANDNVNNVRNDQLMERILQVITLVLSVKGFTLNKLTFSTCFLGYAPEIEFSRAMALLPAETVKLALPENEFTVLSHENGVPAIICRNFIAMFDAIEARRALNPNAILRSLDLFHNDFGDLPTNLISPTNLDMLYIVEVFSRLPTTLTELDLGYSRFDPAIAQQVLQAISARTTGLLRLHLRNFIANDLGNITAIAANLPSGLKYIDLSYNRLNTLNSRELNDFFEAMQQRCINLTEITLSFQELFSFPTDTLKTLFSKLGAKQINLTHLNMRASYLAKPSLDIINIFASGSFIVDFFEIDNWKKNGVPLLRQMLSYDPNANDFEAKQEQLDAALDKFVKIPLEYFDNNLLIPIATDILNKATKHGLSELASNEITFLQNIIILLHQRGTDFTEIAEFKNHQAALKQCIRSITAAHEPDATTTSSSATTTNSNDTDTPTSKRQRFLFGGKN